MDPRIKVPAAALEKKFRAEMLLSSLITQTSEAVLQANSIRDQVQKLQEQANPAIKDFLHPPQQKLAALLGTTIGPFAPPADDLTLTRVNGQATTLYAQLWPSDAEPTLSQTESIGKVEHDAGEITKRWNEFKASDLPALNVRLRNAQLPEIKPEANLSHGELQADEE
jgi:hypothetical protein